MSWGALALALTTLGGIYTWWALRHRGVAAAVRAGGFTLLPLAAWMTGLLEVAGDIGDALGHWLTRLVFSPFVWLGMLLFVVAFVLIGGSNFVSRRKDPEPKAAARRADDAQGGPEDLAARPAHRRRDGRDPGDPEEARHLLMGGVSTGDSDVARHRLWARLSAAVAALDPPPATPLMVVDLDAFDANAADLVRRAAGKPIRLASKSVRVPALIERALATPGLPRRPRLQPAGGPLAGPAGHHRRRGHRLPHRRPGRARGPGGVTVRRGAHHADGRRRRPARRRRLGPVLARRARAGGARHRRRTPARRAARRAQALPGPRRRGRRAAGPAHHRTGRVRTRRRDDVRGPGRRRTGRRADAACPVARRTPAQGRVDVASSPSGAW